MYLCLCFGGGEVRFLLLLDFLLRLFVLCGVGLCNVVVVVADGFGCGVVGDQSSLHIALFFYY